MEQVGSHWMNFQEILYLNILRKSVEKIHAVAQLSKAQRYKLEGRGFNSRWCH
jgi:hypothetical protein